jgi:hypothetical protein
VPPPPARASGEPGHRQINALAPAQRRIEALSNEIPAFAPLLEPLDLRGVAYEDSHASAKSSNTNMPPQLHGWSFRQAQHQAKGHEHRFAPQHFTDVT